MVSYKKFHVSVNDVYTLRLLQTNTNTFNTIGGIIVGGFVVLSFLLTIPPFLSPLRRKKWLYVHAVMIVLTIIAILTLGARIWFTTLQERKMLGNKWAALNDEGRAEFEDKVTIIIYDKETIFNIIIGYLVISIFFPPPSVYSFIHTFISSH